jgi:hypothetical protein
VRRNFARKKDGVDFFAFYRMGRYRNSGVCMIPGLAAVVMLAANGCAMRWSRAGNRVIAAAILPKHLIALGDCRH